VQTGSNRAGDATLSGLLVSQGAGTQGSSSLATLGGRWFKATTLKGLHRLAYPAVNPTPVVAARECA